MKKILLITEKLGSGGAERQICGLAVLLTRAGYICRLITYVKDQFYEPYLHENAVDYEFVSELLEKKTRVLKLASYVRSYNPNVIISYLPSVNKAMCLAKPFFNAKLIVSERNNNTCVTWNDRVLFNLYRMADAIVPNSNSQGMFIRKNFSFLSKKVFPIINFVDVNRFTPPEILSHNDKLRIVTVARYMRQKNIITYLRAIRKVKDKGLNVHFDWYGEKKHDIPYYTQVEGILTALDISDYITLHCSVSNVEREYRNADIFCLPSLYEGYPNVIVEAMSCGLPIICSDRYENPYIVKDGENGFLFDPENVNSIVEAIDKILSLSAEKRTEMGAKNRQICLRRNTEDMFLHKYIELIEGLT